MMKPLINKRIRLERFPGKGGWTYAQVPRIFLERNKPFGWVKVKGTIDGYPISKYHLMPMGKGRLFLPVKAEIRKKINKKEGDLVHVILYPDTDPLEIPDEMLLCLRDEPAALKFFHSLSQSEQNYYIKWIYAARKEVTRVHRLAKSVDMLLRGLKLYDKHTGRMNG